ncbi:MAG: exodeoxyribonuclease VII small subunit [Pseudomonadota bacterium]
MKEPTFEKAMEKLEAIVNLLEKGDLPLEESLAKFEEGMRLSRLLSGKLDEVQKKISLLIQEPGGDVREEPFDESDHGSAEE